MSSPRALLCLGVAASLAAASCSGSSTPRATAPATVPAGPTCIKVQGGSGCLPIAPPGQRVDLIMPTFSNPTSVTNPLHPSAKVDQVIYGGQVDGKPFRTEFTRLPDIKTITWNGRQIKAITMQYLAVSDGRIEEVALDWFAQADDGSVWYLGEDVYEYADGVVSSTEGTWQTGRNGAPAAMIMPGAPKAGDTYRPENLPEVVFEEVTVKSVGQTVPGPSGTISGAITVNELHMDGTHEDKIFAPGYGEFSTGDPKGDLEAATLAVPTDARPGPPSARLTALSASVGKVHDAVGKKDWPAATTAATTLRRAWDAYRQEGLPSLLEKQMTRDIGSLTTAVSARKNPEARRAALRVAQNDLDFRLRHQPLGTIERARVNLWLRQLKVDAAAGDPGSSAGDSVTLGWTWDRVRHTADPATADRVDAQLRTLKQAAAKKDLTAIIATIPALTAALPQ